MMRIIWSGGKLKEIIKNIRDIDKDNNGYVTTTELDDIIKLHYHEELFDKNLKPLFKKYASIQNMILIDYKKFTHAISQFNKESAYRT